MYILVKFGLLSYLQWYSQLFFNKIKNENLTKEESYTDFWAHKQMHRHTANAVGLDLLLIQSGF